MSKINPVLTNYTYQGKPSFLKFVDGMNSISVLPLFGGRRVKLYKDEGDADFTRYSVRDYKNVNTARAVAALIGLFFLIPFLLLVKALSKENKSIANKIANLTEIEASISSKSIRVSQIGLQVGQLRKLSLERGDAIPALTSPHESDEAAPTLLYTWTGGLLGSPGIKPLRVQDFEKVDDGSEIVAAAATPKGIVTPITK